MNDPVQEIEGIIRDLTQTSPSIQRRTIENYFTPNASFQHPFCRTGSFDGSRFLIRAIYRWYKIMSPEIDLEVNSIAYDSKNLVCYVNISQIFRIWFVPFFYAPVNLTTVLRLMHNQDDGKYYLTSQDDLYQVNEWIKFILPGGWMLVWLWQMLATIGCLFLAMAFWPVSWFEEHGDEVVARERKRLDQGNLIVQESNEEAFASIKNSSNGEMITAPAIQQR